MDNSERKEVKKGKVTVDLLKVSDYQKPGSKTAQLRQIIDTTAWYASKQANNSLVNNVFGNEDFGYTSKSYDNHAERVAFINVPVSHVNEEGETVDMTAEAVQEAIDKYPDACIYRVLSNHPILHDGQKYAIREGIRTMDDFANSQVVRAGQGQPNEGEILKDQNGKVQYKVLAFSKSAKEDVELRTDNPKDFYATPEIREELQLDAVDVEITPAPEETASSTESDQLPGQQV